jgi:predicted DCC family thiol-disulfide oxidoreductase YuxK
MAVDINTINNVVLFDGVCNLCNKSVDFLVRNEKGNSLYFASLQSDVGKKLIKKSDLTQVPDSILFYQDGEVYVRSQAILKITKFLQLPYRFGNVFYIVPKVVRDGIYKLIARNRYRWFGKKETCRVPTMADKSKFLG